MNIEIFVHITTTNNRRSELFQVTIFYEYEHSQNDHHTYAISLITLPLSYIRTSYPAEPQGPTGGSNAAKLHCRNNHTSSGLNAPTTEYNTPDYKQHQIPVLPVMRVLIRRTNRRPVQLVVHNLPHTRQVLDHRAVGEVDPADGWGVDLQDELACDWVSQEHGEDFDLLGVDGRELGGGSSRPLV